MSRHAALTEQVADLSQRRIATGPRVTAAHSATAASASASRAIAAAHSPVGRPVG
ncbi:hypothetical protein MAHJHV55_52620 [Mycobacterium avium subsp. hominissuis]